MEAGGQAISAALNGLEPGLYPCQSLSMAIRAGMLRHMRDAVM
jgi:hypothetical protein